DPAGPDDQGEVFEHQLLPGGVAREEDVVACAGQVHAVVDRPLIDAVVVAGNHHHRPAEPAQLSDRAFHRLVADPGAVEQVSGDEHDVDVAVHGRPHDRLQTGHRRLVACNVDVGGVEHPNHGPGPRCT